MRGALATKQSILSLRGEMDCFAEFIIGSAFERPDGSPSRGIGIRNSAMDISLIEDRKTRARSWFEALRDDICLAFEKLEDDAPASLYPGPPARFVRTPWDRADHTGRPGGGGMMSVMRGRLFEK